MNQSYIRLMKEADHFAFEVSNMENSIRFYQETLGLTLDFDKTDEKHQERFAFLQCTGCNIELLQDLSQNKKTPLNPLPQKPYCPHFAIKVKNLDENLQVLEKHNIEVIGPFLNEGEVRWLYFADPDNNILELIEWLA